MNNSRKCMSLAISVFALLLVGQGTMPGATGFTDFAISPQPDFVVRDLSVNPGTVRAGGTTVVAFKILNKGTATAGPANHEIGLAGPVEIQVYPPPRGRLVKKVSTKTLPPGASAPFRGIVTIPPDTKPGAYRIRVWADVANAVSESDEANNWADVPITITR